MVYFGLLLIQAISFSRLSSQNHFVVIRPIVYQQSYVRDTVQDEEERKKKCE